ncbi:unnamed protein product [Gadus morhua 'NCC']
MKSGLPKPRPVHSALPIPQTPGRRTPLATPKSSLVGPRHPSPSPSHPAPGHVRLGWGPLKSLDVPQRESGEDAQPAGRSRSPWQRGPQMALVFCDPERGVFGSAAL